jgi:MFS family permease
MLFISKSEAFATKALFFLFGFGCMMIAPRTPDLKANLHVNNGTLGTLLSLTAIGSFTAFIYLGQIVHRFGVRKVLTIVSTTLFGAMALQPHIHTPWLFALNQVLCGASWAGFHISVNTQALHRQKLSGIPILPKLHGIWTAGALSTAVVAVGITSHVSLAKHIDVGATLVWLATLLMTYRLRDVLVEGSLEHADEDSKASVKAILIYLREEWVIVVAISMGIMLEMSTNDWASLFTKEDIKASSSLSILSYIAFGAGMVIARFNLHTLYKSFTERLLIRTTAIFGGLTFMIGVQVASHIAPKHHSLGLVVAITAYFCGGLGSAFMSPGITTIATRSSRFPSSFVVAQMALVNTIIFFTAKIVISWVAQATSITTALMVPAVVFTFTAVFAKLGSDTLHPTD